MVEVEVFPDSRALIRAEAERVVTIARASVAARGRCLLALAGGSTPRPLYELLAEPAYAPRIDWSRTHLFWGDERCVPPDHPDSNYRMTREALIDRVPLPPENVHRIAGEKDPHEAATDYERLLERFIGPGPTPSRSFDLALLGMGADGHTASIFPGSAAVSAHDHWALPIHVERPREMWRVTLTPMVFNAAGDVTFLVTGTDKAARLEEVLRQGDGPLPPPPARLIRPVSGELHWMVDAAAGARLAVAQG
jgi:6-phosphogluconolactonase